MAIGGADHGLSDGWSLARRSCRRASSCCTASAAPAAPGTASRRSSRRERYRPLALDLPGHGDAAEHGGRSRSPAASSTCSRRARERFALCGYSLGGRVALHVALAAPERVRRLVLVSTSRRHRGCRRARAAREPTSTRSPTSSNASRFEQFIERWRTQPLFADDPPEVEALARADQRRNRPQALAAALRGIGTGEMQPLWERLGELTMPVDGPRRRARREVRDARAAHGRLLPDAELRVVPGGHACRSRTRRVEASADRRLAARA